MRKHNVHSTAWWRSGMAATALSTALATLAMLPAGTPAQAQQAAPQNAQPQGVAIDDQAERNIIQFNSKPAYFDAIGGEVLTDRLEQLAQPGQSQHILVQFDGPITPAQRRTMAANGIELQSYLSSNAWFAKMDAAQNVQAEQIAAMAGLRAVAPIDTDWKLHDFLFNDNIPTWAITDVEYVEARVEFENAQQQNLDAPEPKIPADPTVVTYVMFHPDVDVMPDAWATVMFYGGTVRSELQSNNTLVIELPYSQIKNLAQEDSVMYIEPALPKFAEVNDSNRARVGADVLQDPPYSLDGSGVTVFVYDGGEALASHADFGGRLTVIDSSGLSDHSTHVSGTIGGDGTASSGLRRGMAPGVTIISAGFEQPGGLQQGFLYTDPGDLESDYNAAINTHGAVIANNSIGTNTAPNGFPCDWEGNYGVTSNLIDNVVRGSLGSPMRIVWANGNERQTSRCLGVEGFESPFHSTAPPACAKNHLTVGALNSEDDSVTSFTSFGPTDDGRIKPDVSAPGCQGNDDGGVTSTSSSGGYSTKCGTSMASPTVCGIGALCIQAHRNLTGGGPDMLPSTLKAVLANTAEDLGRPGPDYEYGHGSVRGQPAIDLIQNENFREDSVDQGGVYTAVVLVPAGSDEVRVTLAWDDVPATPLVNPTLVNNLDLHVYDGSGTRYYPFTLDPQDPSANATAVAENTLDNIEQVVISNATPGAYRVEVHGTNVPNGPQEFSLAATPQLVTCSSAGFISTDRVKYPCMSDASVQVIDCDLNTDDMTIETVDITIDSDTEPAGEILTLTEISAETGVFKGTIPLSETDAAGVLHISPGDTVTATYIDADDGGGGVNVTVETTSVVDCTSTNLVSTSVVEANPRDALINVQTDEPASVTIHYGTACGALNDSVVGSAFAMSQDVRITGLQDDTTYFYSIDMEDEAGNMSSDDNGGSCYTFTTPEIPDFFTEQFASGEFDLDNTSMLFVPDAGIDQYISCTTPVATLPIDPAGGTVLSLGDDSAQQITLSGGAQVVLYGVSYSSVWVGPNGYLTFTGGDSDWTEDFDDHFDTPRIAAAFDDLHPGQGGTVSWKQLSDRLVVTWENVPQRNDSDSNTFQIQMYFDGSIEIAWAGMSPTIDCIVGLSEGLGVNVDFFESELSALGDCGPRPPSAANLTVEVPGDNPITIDLAASDDGTPNPLEYVITSLPTFELRDAGNNQVITAVPYTLTSGGNQVIYQADPGFLGSDSFDYYVDDGGSPPDGGQSNLATVTINVLPVLTIPFAEDFEPTSRGSAFDPNRWHVVEGATIDDQSINPPSPTMAARFNGDPNGGDQIVTHLIDLSGESAVFMNYYFEQTGNGESPDSGDDLFVEYLSETGDWVVLNQHPGSGSDMTSFQLVELMLPADALHVGFRLRFRNEATSGNFDDWFVDDVLIGPADAPLADNVEIATPVNTSTSVMLSASDPNGDPLDYVIESLPANGMLFDPFDDSPINSAPYTLQNGGSMVTYSPNTGHNGLDTFQYSATDGQYTSNIATVTVDVGGPGVVYAFPLDSDPGWSTEGDWAFGQPAGIDGDPSSGFSGTNVYGFNLNGEYPNLMGSTEFLTTTAIDMTGVTEASLRFRRWLGVESASFDHANIQVSNDGVNWVTVWDHTGSTLNEQTWSLQEYDISAVADEQATVYIRWGMGPTDGSVTYHGWNVDDVEIWGRAPVGPVGDLDGNGVVDVFDLFELLGAWGPCPAPPASCPADLNDDGVVDVFDLFVLLNNYGAGGGGGLSAPSDILAGNVPAAGGADEDALEENRHEVVFINDGVLVPADHGGYFDVEESFRQTASGELGIELAGKLPVDRADFMVVPGRAMLDGKLTVWLADQFVPQAGDEFTVLVAGKVEGRFADVMLPNEQFEVSYDQSSVKLRMTGEVADNDGGPEIGRHMLQFGADLDRNGRIDVDDVLALIHAWGQTRSRADLNADGVVDSLDLAILLKTPLGPRSNAVEEEVRR